MKCGGKSAAWVKQLVKPGVNGKFIHDCRMSALQNAKQGLSEGSADDPPCRFCGSDRSTASLVGSWVLGVRGCQEDVSDQAGGSVNLSDPEQVQDPTEPDRTCPNLST